MTSENPLPGGLDHLGPSPATLVRENTDLLVENTTVETDLLAYTIPANMLEGDRGIRVTMWGALLQNSGANVNFRFRVKLGATTMWSYLLSYVDPGAAVPAPCKFEIELYAKDSNAAQEFDGVNHVASLTPAPTTGEGHFTNGATGVMHGESAEDGTIALVFAITLEMGTAHVDAQFERRKYLIELI